ncbi:hypothetical protein [Kriegella aquimaris]|uniref:Uncharacterized protein n=1 Tax=Kriegella aquimaris TaxID=192904 RepID=A0A1G9V1F0_9FLAO|nr:hypothetical protein [Kriegella aquimaris]SDM66052.1 hypothetical protein SAMN04488514_11274 [Kriegella aquimaris]
MNWYKPDDRWKIWNIKSKDDFVEKFVVEGKFHSKVPSDIVEAFKTATYLMAHAFFYYPIYDEAMSKILLVMEMAVKLKAKELEIDLKSPPNKKGDVYDKKLYKVIEEICERKYLTFLQPEFDRARVMRNSRMHPNEHTIMGAMGFTNGNAMLFVNIINKLFLSEEDLNYNMIKYDELSAKISKFKQGLFRLDFEFGPILITTIYDFKYLKHKESEILLLYVQPILNNFKENIENYNYEVLVLALKEFELKGHKLKGMGINNKPINIYPNQKQENIVVWESFLQEYDKVNSDNITQFQIQTSRMALWRYEELIYENFWD